MVILQSGTLNIGASGITQNGSGAKAFTFGAGTRRRPRGLELLLWP